MSRVCDRINLMSGTVTMAHYVPEIERAAIHALAAVWEKHQELLDLQQELDVLTRRVQDEYVAIERLHSLDETSDDVMMTTGRYWENYFGEDKDRHAKSEEAKKLEAQIKDQDRSMQAAAGTVLEYAKKGISDVHGGPIRRPGRGRLIGSQHLSEVIWQGRNQSTHAGEGMPHPPTKACMDQLAIDFGNPWPEYLTRSMAFDLIELLAWHSFAEFEADLLSLA